MELSLEVRFQRHSARSHSQSEPISQESKTVFLAQKATLQTEISSLKVCADPLNASIDFSDLFDLGAIGFGLKCAKDSAI